MNCPKLPRRVVITGMGVLTALGSEPERFWKNLLAGQCGIRRMPWITDDSPLPTQYAGWIDDELVIQAVSLNQVRLGVTDKVLVVCADSALDPTSFAVWNRLGIYTKSQSKGGVAAVR